MKQLSDVHKRNDEFAVGNIVYLMLHKRAAHYYRPYPIVERVGVVAYWLRPQESSKVQSVFYISVLKQ